MFFCGIVAKMNDLCANAGLAATIPPTRMTAKTSACLIDLPAGRLTFRPRLWAVDPAARTSFTIRGKSLTNASLHKSIVGLPPLAPPEYRGGGHTTLTEYRGGGHATHVFIPPLYSEGG